jgi:chemotaxis family two-component system response regulator Rcp1
MTSRRAAKGPKAAAREVLLVEDNAGDAELMRIALAEARPDVALRVAADGEEALALLLEGSPPDLVLLDLNLPRLSGHEVLAALRSADEPHVRRLPVIVLTTSAAPGDVARSYDLAAAGHIVKPHEIDDLFDIAATIARYWLETVTLPR